MFLSLNIVQYAVGMVLETVLKTGSTEKFSPSDHQRTTKRRPTNINDTNATEFPKLDKIDKFIIALRKYNIAIERATCHMDAGEYQKALPEIYRSISLLPERIKAHILLVNCSLKLGNMALVKSELNKLSKRNISLPKEEKDFHHVENLLKDVQKAYNAGSFRQAINLLEKCCKICVGCKEFKIKMAECWYKLREYETAIGILNGILCFDEQNVDVLFQRSRCFYYQNDMEKAITNIQRTLRFDPDHKKAVELYKMAKKLKLKKEDGDKAFYSDEYLLAHSCYSEALTVDASNIAANTELYFLKARAAVKLGRIEESITCCNSALRLTPNFLKALIRRADSYIWLRRYDEAIADLKNACDIKNCKEYRKKLSDTQRLARNCTEENYYMILGVDKTADLDTIRKAFKIKAMKHHPDRHVTAAPLKKLLEETEFKKIAAAYYVLSNPEMRRSYDCGRRFQ